MSWEILTTESGSSDPVAAYAQRKLAEYIRDHFDRLDHVAVSWRRGSSWIPAPLSISLPRDAKKRKLASPEDGASRLWALAYAHAEKEQAKELKFEGLGDSASGDSTQVLFRHRVKPFDGREEEAEPQENKLKNIAIEAAQVQKDLIGQLGTHLEKLHHREISLLDKCIATLETNRATTRDILYGMAFERAMKVDAQDHEEEMEKIRFNAKLTDSVLDIVKKPMQNTLEQLLVKVFKLDPTAFTGSTFAERLTAIVTSVGHGPDGGDRLMKVKNLVGDDGWSLLQAMSKAENDDAFKAMGQKFLETLGENPTGKLQSIALALGEGPALALLNLVNDAGLADG